MLQTRGTLTELLTSNDALHTVACNLSDSSLSILLSSLYQSEICDISSGISVNLSGSFCGQGETITRSPRTPTASNRRSSSVHVLRFVDRLIVRRFPSFQNFHSTNSCIFDAWSNAESYAGAAMAMNDGCRPPSSGFWIPCMIFMMAYTALRNHLTCGTFSSPSDGNGNGEDGDRGRSPKEDAMRNVRNDPTVITAIRLIFFSKILAIAFDRNNCGYGDGDGDGDGPCTGASINGYVLKAFTNEMEKVDALIGSLQEVTSTSNTNHDAQVEGKGDCQIIPSSSTEVPPPQTRSVFDKLWDKVQAEDLSSCGEEEDAAERDDNLGKKNSPVQVASPNNGDDQHANAQVDTSPQKAVADITPQNSSTKDVERGESPPTQSSTNGSTMKAYEKIALDLRPRLLQMSHNAVSNEIENMTNQILSILKEGGSQDGVDGIVKVASIFKSGSTTVQNEHDTKNKDVHEHPFSDPLVSSLSKAYVTNSLSASRVSAYLQSFVLPSILALNEPKSRPASRQLVTTLTFHARDRPAECTSALFVPTMVGNTDGGVGASKAQCELINRIVKTIHVDELPKLISELVPMKLTESSVAVMTTCIQKKPILPDSIVVAIVEKLKKCAGESDLAKNTKFSSFFHAFVNKYGSQLQKLNCINDLLDASEKLKTFMRKAIATSLNKLSKKTTS
jgi:hypothetical protein